MLEPVDNAGAGEVSFEAHESGRRGLGLLNPKSAISIAESILCMAGCSKLVREMVMSSKGEEEEEAEEERLPGSMGGLTSPAMVEEAREAGTSATSIGRLLGFW